MVCANFPVAGWIHADGFPEGFQISRPDLATTAMDGEVETRRPEAASRGHQRQRAVSVGDRLHDNDRVAVGKGKHDADASARMSRHDARGVRAGVDDVAGSVQLPYPRSKDGLPRRGVHRRPDLTRHATTGIEAR